jgi:tryptophanyl-tRNA synthetase
VSAHAELAWILNCYTYLGELNRMTQFKDKSRKNETNINAGLLTYPVLMAADILLYNADIVPVGEDQRQHLELTRDIAERFNGIYGETFVVPAPVIEKVSGRVMGLVNPEAKMSKSESDNQNNVIFLSDEPNAIKNKIKRAVTDSGGDVIYSDEKPGIKNLLNIYSSIENKSIDDCEKEFAGAGYGAFKSAVGEAVAEKISEIQVKYNSLIKNKDFIDNIIRTGAEKASKIANKTLAKVKKKVGLLVI